jgi:hypothetical protein
MSLISERLFVFILDYESCEDSRGASSVLKTFEFRRISFKTSEAIASSIDLHSVSVIKPPDMGYVLKVLVSAYAICPAEA